MFKVASEMMAQSQGTLKKSLKIVIFAICLTHYLLLLQALFAYLINKKRETWLEAEFLHIFSLYSSFYLYSGIDISI